MSDPLDLITLAEAHSAINLSAANTTQDDELAQYVTAVSRRIDDLCGPVVIRSVTETYGGGVGSIVLRAVPVAAVTSVTEYSAGAPTTLTAESLTAQGSTNYAFDTRTGVISRRSGWADSTFAAQNVVVVFDAGRYVSTAAVDAKFKQAAAIMLAHLWRREQGAGTVTFAEAQFDDTTLTPSFAVPKAVLELLSSELLAPAIA